RANRQHVGVIVLADHARRECVGADAATNTPDLVRRHHDALAGAAQDDAEPAIAGGDEPRRRFAMLWIVRALGCRRPDIGHHPALPRDVSADGLPHLDRGVIAGKNDTVAGCHGEVRFPAASSRLDRVGSVVQRVVNGSSFLQAGGIALAASCIYGAAARMPIALTGFMLSTIAVGNRMVAPRSLVVS